MFDFFFMAKQQARNTERGFADIGQLDVTAVAHEQPGAVTFLEFLDLAGKCRLGDVQHLRGAGETAVGGDRVERT